MKLTSIRNYTHINLINRPKYNNQENKVTYECKFADLFFFFFVDLNALPPWRVTKPAPVYNRDKGLSKKDALSFRLFISILLTWKSI